VGKLNDKAVAALKPLAKDFKVSDGEGLFLLTKNVVADRKLTHLEVLC